MSTEALFRQDAYLRTCEARITSIDESGLMLDRTVFYPQGGGQAGDCGWLVFGDETRLRIADTRKARFSGAGLDDVVHLPAEGQTNQLRRLTVGQLVRAEIEWDRRFRHMRLHTASHLMCAILPYHVNGCSITADYARLDFVTSDPLSRDYIEAGLAALIASNKAITIDTISYGELLANPDLIRTMSVKPPMGMGSVRLVGIEGVDLQPCGGTHVASTLEVGAVRIAKMEKKTARTRRVVLAFA